MSQSSAEYIELENQLGAKNYKPLDVVLERGEGVWLYDVEGRRYLDCLASYSAVNQGHCHPKILAALEAQARKLTLTSRAFRNDQLPRLYQALHKLTGYDKVLMMNSGAEAVETAVKAARKWGYQVKGIPAGRARLVTAANNFHGRTTTLVSFSTEAQYQEGFGPFTPGFDTVPFGDLPALEAALGPDTAAFLVEPIQAEAGIYLPPAGYLKAAADLCKQRNILFIADEIQTGLGRTGRLLACDHEGVRPDVLILGKALSGGFYPVSAVLASVEILGVFRPGDHGSTFGGNPLGCAVAQAALKVIQDEGLSQRAARLGDWFRHRLTDLRHPLIKEVRGRGLLIGVELTVPARPVAERLQDLGLLVKDTHGTILRFTPPLVIEQSELDWAADRLAVALEAAAP